MPSYKEDLLFTQAGYNVGSAVAPPNVFSQNLNATGASSGTTVVVASAVASGTLTLPATTDTLVGRATADALSNKTALSVVTSPAGTSRTNPVQSLGNTATPSLLGVTWSSMSFAANIVPAGSNELEMDGVFGFIENASATTNTVGVRGQGAAGVNNASVWGGNLLAEDYDHNGTIYTNTKLNGLEIDINTRSTTTTGFGLSLIQGGPGSPAVPVVLPAIGIAGNNGGLWSQGLIVQSAAVTPGNNAIQVGSQGATGVANKPSAPISAFGYNSGGVAKGWNFLSSQDGDFIIVPTAGRGVGIGLGGTLTNPTEPAYPLDVSGAARFSGGIVGSATNDSASTGNYGEFVRTKQATPQALSTGTLLSLGSISLTAGDWDVQANGAFSGNTTTITFAEVAISTANNSVTPNDGSFENIAANSIITATAIANGHGLVTPLYRVSISATTSYFLVAQATFGSGTCSVAGTIRARRVR